MNPNKNQIVWVQDWEWRWEVAQNPRFEMIGVQDWECIEKQPETHSLLINRLGTQRDGENRPGIQRDGDPTPRGGWQGVDAEYTGRVNYLVRDKD